MRRILSPTIAAALTASALAAAGGAPPSVAAEAWQAPRSERLVSGPSRPAVAAWGLAHNPVTGELVVGDYMTNQVRRYSRDGTFIADFTNPKGNTEGVASAVAVDPRDGSTYVAMTGDGRTSRAVRKYDAAGDFLFDFNLDGSTTWLTVDDQGRLWSPQAFGGTAVTGWTVSDSTKSATRIAKYSSTDQCTGSMALKRLTGIDVDAAGNIYVADPGIGTVHVFSPDGTSCRNVGDRKLFKGDMRGVHVDDATGRLYVANSQVGTIEAFDLAGNRLYSFSGLGGTGSDDLMVDGARQLTMTPDGRLLAADYGSRRVVEFEVGASSGTYVSHFPDPLMLPDPAGVADPRGLAVDPTDGSILVADGWNQRVQRFAPDGELLKVHGRRGSFTPDGMNYPRAVEVDPANGNVWLPNYEGDPDLVVYDRHFGVVGRIATPRFINDIEFATVDGERRVYALVRRPGYVMVFDPDDLTQPAQVIDPKLGYLRGIGVDAATGTMWVTSDSKRDMWVLSPTGARLATLYADKRPWGVAMSGDVVYVADANDNSVIAFDRTTYARLGEFGTSGFGPGQLRGPSGIDVDAAGRLHVVEQRNSRVQVFGWSPSPAAETLKPTATLDTTAGTTTPLVLTGTAADDTAVNRVEVLVQDTATGLYWNVRSGQWGTFQWMPAISWGPGASVDWRFTLVPAEAGKTYTVRVRAVDVNRNVSKVLSRTLTAGA